MPIKMHTPDQVREGAQLADAILLSPHNRQYLVRLLVDTFMNGMEAQRELTSAMAPTPPAAQAPRPGA